MVAPNQRFHCSDEALRKQAENSLQKKIKTNTITEQDADIIRTFVSEVAATKSISNARRYKLVNMLANSRKWLTVPFREMTTIDLFSAIDKLQNDPNITQNTKGDFIRFLKRISLWMIENEIAHPGLKVEKIRKITPPAYTSDKNPGDLLTPGEVKTMIDHCRNSRDRAIIATLYEGGLRIGEVANLQMKNLQINDWNVSLKIVFKTGKSRHIPLVMAMPYLKSYLNDRGEVGPDDFLFLTPRGDPLQYQAVRNMILRVGKSAGIDKPLNPHGFRHSRITEMIKEGFGESIVRKVAWGNQSTKMMATYLHLVDNDVDDAVAEMYGVKSAEKRKRDDSLDPIQCPRCSTINRPNSRYCDACGLALSEEVATGLAEMVTELESDEMYKRMFQEFLTKMKGHQ